jgi:hypothetical protein
MPVGTVVASFNPTGSGVYTYTLVPGPGGQDNTSFTISGNSLTTAAVFNSTTQSTYHIRVRVTDASGVSTDQPLTIEVMPTQSPEEEISVPDDKDRAILIEPASVSESEAEGATTAPDTADADSDEE